MTESHRQSPSREIYPALDILKFVLAFFVVAEHTAVLGTMTGVWHRIGESILWPAVDIFFVISGFLCYDRAQGSSAALERRLLKSAKTIFLMYVWWTLIYLPLNIALTYKAGSLNGSYVLQSIRIFLFSGMWTDSPQLWYLLALGLGYLILYWTVRQHINLWWVFIISGILNVIGFFMPWITAHSTFIRTAYRFTFADSRNVVFVGMFYICCGALIAEYKQQVRSINPAAFFATFALGMIGSVAFNPSGHLPFSSMVIISTVMMAIRYTEATAHKAMRSTGTIIYLIHMYVVRVVQFGLAKIDIAVINGNVLCFIITSFVAFIFACAAQPLIHRNRVMTLLFHA